MKAISNHFFYVFYFFAFFYCENNKKIIQFDDKTKIYEISNFDPIHKPKLTMSAKFSFNFLFVLQLADISQRIPTNNNLSPLFDPWGEISNFWISKKIKFFKTLPGIYWQIIITISYTSNYLGQVSKNKVNNYFIFLFISILWTVNPYPVIHPVEKKNRSNNIDADHSIS